jgi:hypothetical protein
VSHETIPTALKGTKFGKRIFKKFKVVSLKKLPSWQKIFCSAHTQNTRNKDTFPNNGRIKKISVKLVIFNN